jgi:hypothetical protein
MYVMKKASSGSKANISVSGSAISIGFLDGNGNIISSESRSLV